MATFRGHLSGLRFSRNNHSLFHQAQRRQSRGPALRAAALEALETRTLLSAYNPMNVRSAYGFDAVQFTDSGGNIVKGDGAGQTMAIVDAFDTPTLFTDVDYFDGSWRLNRADNSSPTYLDAYGAASTFLTKATPQGTPANDVGWSLESLLDVEWAHATAPRAKIMLVEAKSASNTDLLAAVDYARNQDGVSVISMSWGMPEFAGETSYDSHFTTPANHIGGYDAQGNALLGGITFVAASGDTGAQTLWPAVSPNVVAVGGTTLQINTSTFADSYVSESGWSGSGGGISTYESKPAFQSGVTLSSNRRTTPDVAYDADPNTGFYVRDTNGYSGWTAVGGTSAGSPQWASIIAVANQGRALSGKGSLDGVSQTLPALYGLNNSGGSYFHDITTGSTAYRKTKLKATAGYDLVTGLGSPIPRTLTQALLAPGAYVSSGAAAAVVTTGSATPAASMAATEVGLQQATRAPLTASLSMGRSVEIVGGTSGLLGTGTLSHATAEGSFSRAWGTSGTALAAAAKVADRFDRPTAVLESIHPVQRSADPMSLSTAEAGMPLALASQAQGSFDGWAGLGFLSSPVAFSSMQASINGTPALKPSDFAKTYVQSLSSAPTTAAVIVLAGCWYTGEIARQRIQRRSRSWMERQPGGCKMYFDSVW